MSDQIIFCLSVVFTVLCFLGAVYLVLYELWALWDRRTQRRARWASRIVFRN